MLDRNTGKTVIEREYRTICNNFTEKSVIGVFSPNFCKHLEQPSCQTSKQKHFASGGRAEIKSG